jgi:hypothetical protein
VLMRALMRKRGWAMALVVELYSQLNPGPAVMAQMLTGRTPRRWQRGQDDDGV